MAACCIPRLGLLLTFQLSLLSQSAQADMESHMETAMTAKASVLIATVTTTSRRLQTMSILLSCLIHSLIMVRTANVSTGCVQRWNNNWTLTNITTSLEMMQQHATRAVGSAIKTSMVTTLEDVCAQSLIMVMRAISGSAKPERVCTSLPHHPTPAMARACAKKKMAMCRENASALSASMAFIVS